VPQGHPVGTGASRLLRRAARPARPQVCDLPPPDAPVCELAPSSQSDARTKEKELLSPRIMSQPVITESPRAEGSESVGGVTARAAVLGFALVVAVSVGAFYVELAWNKIYTFGSGVPAMAPVVLLFLLSALMATPVLRRVALTRRELLTVYSILLIGGPLVSHGILFWMIPKVIAYYYVARIQPLWETTFFPYVPMWFAPTDPIMVEGFFQGHARVPWSAWWGPLGAWSSFFAAIFVCTLCAVALVQRQWISNERLTFPIAQIPLEMVRETNGGRSNRAGLPIAWVFWLGLGVSLLVNFMNSLSSRVPSIPAIPLGPVAIVQWQKVGPLAGLGEIDLVLWPWMIAIAYLIPKELSFSAWFFWLVRLALTVGARRSVQRTGSRVASPRRTTRPAAPLWLSSSGSPGWRGAI
jgi:hypothetical protein